MIYFIMFDKYDFIGFWVVAILLVAVKAVIFWVFWNWLVVSLLNLPQLGFWQSVGGWYLWMIISIKFDSKRSEQRRTS